MKIFLLIFSLTTSIASADVDCDMKLVRSLIPKVEAHSNADKNQHCSISCLLGLRCSSAFVTVIAYSKEIQDLFTPGDADWDDIKADMLGLELAKKGRARKDKDCFEQCGLYYRR